MAAKGMPDALCAKSIYNYIDQGWIPGVANETLWEKRTLGTGAFRTVFKSITADNGTEFLDAESMEKSAFSKKMRTQMFYAHPYSSWERGSNENGNRIIRRFIAKERFGKENTKTERVPEMKAPTTG